MALAVANQAAGSGTSITYTAASGSVVVLIVYLLDTNAGFNTVTGVTDTGGLTWHRRSAGRVAGAYANSSGVNMGCEVWWANATSAKTSKVITLTYSNSGFSVQGPFTRLFTVTGSLTPSAPWDSNATAYQFWSNKSTAQSISVPYTTVGTADLVMSSVVSTELAVQNIPNIGAGWTVFTGQGGSNNTQGFTSEFQVQSGAGAVTPPWTNSSQNSFVSITDAFTSGASGSSADTSNTGAQGVITTTLTKANLAVTAQNGVPYVHATAPDAFDSTGTATSIAATITTTVPTVVIAVINIDSLSTIRTVTGVSGGGLTWAKRGGTSGQNSPVTFSLNSEVWWANATGALTAQTITASLSGAANNAVDMTLFAVAGSGNPSSPWDTSGQVPNHVSKMSATLLSAMSGSASLNSTKSLSLAFSAVAWNNHPDSTTPTGYTDILAPHVGTTLQSYRAWQTNATGGSKSAAFGNNQEFFQFTFDALTGDTTATTGTISTTLTKAAISAAAKETFIGTVTTSRVKASQAAAGWTTVSGTVATNLTKVSQAAVDVETFIGTISTALTKAALSLSGTTFLASTIATRLTKLSQSLSAKETMTGTITTTLTKANLSLTGTAIASTGVITTHLTKASLSLAATEKFIANTVTTTLRGVSEAGAGWTTVRGTMVTTLRGISQISSPDLEIFTGTIVTNIDTGAAIHLSAHTFEIFTGTVVTRLGQPALALIALEEFIGTATTRLGGENGKMTATVVQALEIIEGPLETVLPPFRPLILGAELGTPGGGKWFSWRYNDA